MLRLSSSYTQQAAGEPEPVRLSGGRGGSAQPLSRAASMEPDTLISAELVPLNEPLQPG